MHQHVLWGIDDGPQTREETFALLRRDAEQGIGIVAATPHVLPGVRPFDMLRYRERLAEAQAYCSGEDLPVRIISGAEIRYTPLTLSMLLDHRIPTLGDSKHVLLEFWEQVDCRTFEEAVSQLYRHGFLPIIAHVERYRLFWREPSFLRSMKDEYSVYYQVNCDFALKRSISASLLFHRMLRNHIPDLFATDAHNLASRPPRMAEAFQVLSEKKNTEALKLFACQKQ